MHRAYFPTLITVNWLKDLISQTGVLSKYRILDASWHLPSAKRDAIKEFKEVHIPGAQFFDVDECADKSRNLPHMIPSVKVFEEYVNNLGINNDTHVIVYDNNAQFPLFSAQRVWMTFRSFGHEKVSILEGGLPKWIAENGPVTEKIETVPIGQYKSNFNSNLIKQMADIMNNLKNSEFQLVDARPEGRFKGIAPEPRDDTKPGCIPKSVNIPFMNTMNLNDRTMKSPEELRQLFQSAGVDLDKPVVFTCGSGTTACVLALASYLLGKENFAIYDGSWTEWYRDAPPELKLNVPQ
ncbi:3-mercaptopyruvate sulfurtransferase [Biomphalaria glabrata]|uniref:Rhodanese domain-containing protein n=1 Tax=Biomphalaria glabrata TaxID=6526 RepID=A0A2C9JGA3_BIOGL|nr:3-mercaptopyruvate sulfurtransferase [Biomphalaria glabrata]